MQHKFANLRLFDVSNIEVFAKQLGFAEIKFLYPFEEPEGKLVSVMKK